MYHNPTRAAMDAATDSKPRRVGLSASVAPAAEERENPERYKYATADTIDEWIEGSRKAIAGLGTKFVRDLKSGDVIAHNLYDASGYVRSNMRSLRVIQPEFAKVASVEKANSDMIGSKRGKRLVTLDNGREIRFDMNETVKVQKDVPAVEPAEVEPAPEVNTDATPEFKTHSKWSIQDSSYAGVITKPAVAEYKKTPGSLNAAVYAAAFYAKRDGVDMAVIEGNSYGSSVYQIQGLTKDIAAVTVMRSETSIVIAKPDGKLYKAKAVPVVDAAPADEPVQPEPTTKKLNYSDFTYRYEGEAIAILNVALEADEIRKVDFEAVKSSINRAIDMQRNEIQKEWLNSRDKEAATYPLEEDLYYTSMSLNTLNSAKKKALKAQGTYIGDAVLKLVSKYEPVAAALEGVKPKIVTRQVKTEEQKAAEKAEKLIPKTDASAALFSAIDNEVETKRPAIVADIKAGIERLLKTIQKRRGDSLASMFSPDAGSDARKDEGIFGSEISRLLTDEEFIQKKRSAMTAIERKASAINNVPALEKIRYAREIAAQVAIVDSVPVLDDAKMEAYANREVDDMFAAIKVKMLEKAGEIENPKVEDLSHYQFAITGQMKGRTVRIEQDIIINRSANGKAFNQFPARIYVDGKFTSEADYKTMMTA